jgi:uncharacterized protein
MTKHARRGMLTLAAAAAFTLMMPVAATAQTAAKHKVVFQVSDADPGKWNLALNNAKNVGEELSREGVDLEIVVYGPGIGMLKADSTVGNRVADAVKGGVKVVACENTMKAFKLTQADMLATIGYVPAGVVELMKKQGEGYAYIRP